MRNCCKNIQKQFPILLSFFDKLVLVFADGEDFYTAQNLKIL